MGFPETDTAVKQERVEGSLTRLGGDGVAGSACKAVAISFEEVLERVICIKLGINVNFFDSRNNEGVGYRLADVDRHVDRRVAGVYLPRRSGDVDGVLAPFIKVVFHDNRVFQTAIRAEEMLDCLAQQ